MRPCTCDKYVGPHLPWGPDNCVLCYRFHYSLGHRRVWGGDDKVRGHKPRRSINDLAAQKRH